MSFDDDARKKALVNWLLGIAAFIALFASAQFFFGWLIGFVVITPVIGVAVSVFLVKHGAGVTFRWLKRMALNDQQGIHHAFHDHPVRVRWQNNDCQTLAADVFDILHHQADTNLLRRLALQYGNDGFFRDERGAWWFSGSALLDWLHRRSQSLDQQTLRLHRWFNKEVFPPMRKKAELGGDAASVGKG
ncbi:hypothetical protein [Azonexus sp.]|uniref:hypothetical protein n=1 Tax=Azonexus sp. TaxID=1872668 RepID=UPI0035AE0446